MDAILDAYKAFCCWHLAENVKKKFSKKVQYTFQKLVYVQTSRQQASALEKFKEVGGEVSIYIYLTIIYIVIL